MVSRRRNIIKKDVPVPKASFRTKKALQKLEVNGNVPLANKVQARLTKTEAEPMQQVEEDFQIGSSNMITNDKMNNNYVQSNNCSRNSDRLRKSVGRSCNYISVPKKQSKRNTRSNVELNNSCNQESHQNGEEANNISGKSVKSRKRRKLTEEDVSERLRAISAKLKKSPEIYFDDEEEDERLEIEHKLMALNKESGTFINDYPDLDDRLKDEDEEMISVVDSKTPNNRVSVTETLVGAHKPIIVTQKPDGQLHGCPNCSEVFLSELDLFRHKREAHRSPKITMDTNLIKKYYDLPDRSKCPVCKKVLTSTSKTIYIKHLQSHNSVGEFVCSVCKRVFKRKDHMRMHEKRHIV